jgi:hypothetical protein
MPAYQAFTDELLEAADAHDLIEQLRRQHWDQPKDDKAYRRISAFWTRELYGVRIRTRTNEAFVADMLAHGFYRIVSRH